MFCLYTSSKQSRPQFEFSLKVKGLNLGYLLKYFLFYRYDWNIPEISHCVLVRLMEEETTAALMAAAVGFMLELLLLLFDGIILVWCCKTLVAWMAILISFKAAATDSSDWHAGGVSSDPEIKKAKKIVIFVQKRQIEYTWLIPKLIPTPLLKYSAISI